MNNNLQKGPWPYSEKVLKKRKMLLVLPLLMVPFLTMAFWALGGGKGNPSGNAHGQSGLNLQLPSAHLKEDKSETKLTDYEKADQDSLKRESLRNNDPLFSLSPPGDDPLKGSNGNQAQSPFQTGEIQE